jgi:two-component system nitrate/nitrite response regulator NarL
MTPAAIITVYIAEDHPVFREAVARAVRARPDFELVGATGDGGVALEEIRAVRPAVALLDQQLPGLAGVEVVRAIAAEQIQTRVVMVSGNHSSSVVYEVIKLGVSGFLTKAANLTEICDAVAAVARGETVLAPEAQAILVRELRELEERPVLTKRETAVLKLIAEGLSGPEIGERLFISPSTVKTHVKSINEKLGVNDRAAAVAEAIRRGVID